jgi:hypothetical protein
MELNYLNSLNVATGESFRVSWVMVINEFSCKSRAFFTRRKGMERGSTYHSNAKRQA